MNIKVHEPGKNHMRTLQEAKVRLEIVRADYWPLSNITSQYMLACCRRRVALTDAAIFVRHRSPALVLSASQSLSPRTKD